ncbi:hypothetical protein LSAT2_017946 [Lamellibrachia satsuma]|nr:hypothetical protein LSAT2_017946 [Lamellibrachia satsuma]
MATGGAWSGPLRYCRHDMFHVVCPSLFFNRRLYRHTKDMFCHRFETFVVSGAYVSASKGLHVSDTATSGQRYAHSLR